MDNVDRFGTTRHAKFFALLRQEQMGQRPAEKAKAASARYLDDAAAAQMITRAVRSLNMTSSDAKPEQQRVAARRTAPLSIGQWIKRTRLRPNPR